MSSPETGTRNFSLFIPTTLKEELKGLAKKSENMSLTAYIDALLRDAVKNQVTFELVVQKVQKGRANG